MENVTFLMETIKMCIRDRVIKVRLTAQITRRVLLTHILAPVSYTHLSFLGFVTVFYFVQL